MAGGEWLVIGHRVVSNQMGGAAAPLNPVAAAFSQNGTSPQPSPQSGEGAAPKSAAPGASRTGQEGAPAATADFDPEVGF